MIACNGVSALNIVRYKTTYKVSPNTNTVTVHREERYSMKNVTLRTCRGTSGWSHGLWRVGLLITD